MKTKNLKEKTKPMTYMVHAVLCDKFEDIYVEARNEQEAIRKAKRRTSLKSIWTNFII